MQPMLDRYQQRLENNNTNGSDGHHNSFSENEDAAFEELIRSYKNDYGTEGHDLQPYRELLQLCRQTTTKGDSSGNKNIDIINGCPKNNDNHSGTALCEIQVHGGFIPRNHAARLNKECPDDESKRLFFEEMSSSECGYLPKEGDAMYGALFDCNSSSSSSAYNLRGTPEHRLLIQSLMSGTDLYSPMEVEGHNAARGEDEAPSDESDEESPMTHLYQAQLLKDHAMGFRIASLMLDHYQTNKPSSSSIGNPLSLDRYIVIAGYGHLKHYLGVPDCVSGYLRQEALLHPDGQRRAAAMDLLLSISRRPLSTTEATGCIRRNKFGGDGSALIGCQMMYEAYLEESYPPMMEAADDAPEDDDYDDDDGDDISEGMKQKMLKDLYLQHPKLLDEYILNSQPIADPLLRFASGIAGFKHPCADYLFVYDEDDDNVIDQCDLDDVGKKCPFHQQTNSENENAKDETAEAYEAVGKTAGMKGNVARARAIMRQIGYEEEDLAYIGNDDIYNFQGVANPHIVAKIQSGEAVLDIGSGLGIDSFLAMRDSGADDNSPPANEEDGVVSCPFVVGVDLAESEVKHTKMRASERGYSVPQRIQFIRGDVENLDEAFATKNFLMGTFDVCISNGAFCLVPNKSKAFSNVYKALRPGGRMAISTTTIVSDQLDPSFEWPVCMRMFASLESIKPICESIGFENVRIVDAESPLEGMDVPIEEECSSGNVGGQRFKIHGRNADQFTYLEDMDMDELCKVVTVYGEKPL